MTYKRGRAKRDLQRCGLRHAALKRPAGDNHTP